MEIQVFKLDTVHLKVLLIIDIAQFNLFFERHSFFKFVLITIVIELGAVSSSIIISTAHHCLFVKFNAGNNICYIAIICTSIVSISFTVQK